MRIPNSDRFGQFLLFEDKPQFEGEIDGKDVAKIKNLDGKQSFVEFVETVKANEAGLVI